MRFFIHDVVLKPHAYMFFFSHRMKTIPLKK
jgi:hypothetical protein